MRIARGFASPGMRAAPTAARRTSPARARDIALAQKYAGGTPHVLVRAAGLAFLVDHDLRRALGLIEAAEQVGPLDADLLLTKGNFLMFAGRLEESLAVQAQAARLDPGNARIYRYWVSNLAAAHRPVETMRVLRDFDSRFPGRLYRGEYLFAVHRFDRPLVGRGRAAAWRWRSERDAVGRVRPAALRAAVCRPARAACRRRRPPSSRSTARSAGASGRA